MANEYHDLYGAHVIDDDSGILREYGRRWQISRPLGMWCALRRSPDGRAERYLVARSATELAGKLARADSDPFGPRG